ncbi:Hypothetical protein FKW44_023720, partial [Caligus rogercresseyi]
TAISVRSVAAVRPTRSSTTSNSPKLLFTALPVLQGVGGHRRRISNTRRKTPDRSQVRKRSADFIDRLQR